MSLIPKVKSIIAQRHRRNLYAPEVVHPGQPRAEMELLKALEFERDPPLTEREWSQEEGLARARYASKRKRT